LYLCRLTWRPRKESSSFWRRWLQPGNLFCTTL